jgi:hypothetical protein
MDTVKRRERLHSEGEDRKVQEENNAILLGHVVARLLRTSSGHKPMLQEELQQRIEQEKRRIEALRTKSKAPSSGKDLVAHVLDERLTAEQVDSLSERLYLHGRKKISDLEKEKEKKELQSCTFRPKINDTPCERKRSPSLPKTSATPAARSSSAKRCESLYHHATSLQRRREELQQRAEAFACQQILESKMSSDHHFQRRVRMDPSLATAFLESLHQRISPLKFQIR